MSSSCLRCVSSPPTSIKPCWCCPEQQPLSAKVFDLLIHKCVKGGRLQRQMCQELSLWTLLSSETTLVFLLPPQVSSFHLTVFWSGIAQALMWRHALWQVFCIDLATSDGHVFI
mmetsp:Transcript_7336/g.16614  ORF Transcript_7336/g.16614 Transcript_7336/m.16614 type:complete len:114 (+) Transcript_7336:436-777(+)